MKKIFFGFLLLFFSIVVVDANAQLVDEKNFRIAKYNKGKHGSKAPKRVFIQNFKILFEVYEEATASTSGGKSDLGMSTTYTSGTVTRMGVQIDGVDVPDFQGIVDAAYASFTKQLTDAGFEIISADEVAKTEFMADYTRKEGGVASVSQLKGHVMVTPTGSSYFVKRETKKGKEKGTFTDQSSKLSKELGDAFIADVFFVFPFIELDANSSEILKASSVKGKVSYKLAANTMDLTSLVPIEYPSGVKFVSGHQVAPLFELKTELKKDVDFEGVFKDEKFKEMTAAKKESFAKAAYPRVVMVSGDATSMATHFAECDRDGYISAASGVIEQILRLGIENFIEQTQP